ncbi:MAG: alkaline phosphatase family protein [Candidatus Melainabacteria bacterium]|nr:alkaline phosphatase family protein [Candidatus Melainabacteria bacterium]
MALRTKLLTSLSMLVVAAPFALTTVSALGLMAPQAARAQTASTIARPKLILMVVADKMSASTLSRLQDRLSSSGIRYLIEQGAVFNSCRYPQATTQAAAGDAVISTGSLPWSNGIVGDQWLDRKRNKTIDAVYDEQAQLVGANGQAAGLKFLQGTTIGDQMKLATNGRSKVFSLAVHSSDALLLGGKLINGALWLDQKTGGFVTGNQYTSGLPNFAKAYNDTRPAEAYTGKPWQRVAPEAQYGASTRDDASYERALPGDGKAFPHMIGTAVPGEGAYSTLAMSPMANQMVIDLAKEAITKENLGSHTDPDMLVLGLTAGKNLVGYFGPNSQETQDMVMRMDQGLSSLFGLIDQRIGLNNTLVVFTANSGAQPIPEFAKERGLEGGRIDPKSVKNTIDGQLDNRLGQDDWIEAVELPNVYLNFSAIDKNKYRQPEVESLAAKIAHSVPGVAEVYTQAQLYTNQVPSGPFAEAARKSFYWGRSGELIIVPKAGYVFSGESTGTASGSPFTADSQVPLVMAGSGISPGRYGQATSPADIAPTLAAILGIDAPAMSEGTPLSFSMGQFSGPPRSRQAAPVQAESDKDSKDK